MLILHSQFYLAGSEVQSSELLWNISSTNLGETEITFHRDTMEEITHTFKYGFLLILAGTLFGISFGLLRNFLWGYNVKSGNIQGWVLGLSLASYILLVPGITSPVLNVSLWVYVPALKTSLSSFSTRPGQMLQDSMLSIIQILFTSGSIPAGLLVGFYSIVVPGIKLVLLLIIMIQQEFMMKADQSTIKVCINYVKFISKWDSPKLFSYLVMIVLFNSLHHPPEVVSEGRMDEGFALYLLFSLGTLIAAVALQEPSEDQTSSADESVSSSHEVPFIIKKFGMQSIHRITLAATVLYVMLLVYGGFVPCVAMDLQPPLTVKLAEEILPFVPKLAIEDWPPRTTSLFGCLAHSVRSGIWNADINSLFIILLLGVFVVGFSSLHMLLLLLSAWMVKNKSIHVHNGPPSSSLHFIINMLNVANYLSMLDVFLMGCIVTCFTTKGTLAAAGTTMSLRQGMFWLMGAELVRSFSHHCVLPAIAQIVKQSNDHRRVDADNQLG